MFVGFRVAAAQGSLRSCRDPNAGLMGRSLADRMIRHGPRLVGTGSTALVRQPNSLAEWNPVLAILLILQLRPQPGANCTTAVASHLLACKRAL